MLHDYEYLMSLPGAPFTVCGIMRGAISSHNSSGKEWEGEGEKSQRAADQARNKNEQQ